MTYRTKTYIAGGWTEDWDLIEKLYEWNNSDYWALNFVDAHEFMQARDSSLCCSIKRSLSQRLEVSKTFVLIVGKYTNELRKGGCQYCSEHNSYAAKCARNYYQDYRSYIEYECECALEQGLRIVVIYNGESVRRNDCPEVLRNKGIHLNGRCKTGCWNYAEIRDAIMYG